MKLYIQKIIFIALTLLLFNACQDDDSGALFDQSATVRKTKKTEELRNILMSSENGWIARYFTDEEVYLELRPPLFHGHVRCAKNQTTFVHSCGRRHTNQRLPWNALTRRREILKTRQHSFNRPKISSRLKN